MSCQVLLVLLVAVLWTGGECASCTEYNVGRCVKPMEQFKIQDKGHVTPTYNRSKLAEICRVYDGVEDCLDDLRSSCTSTEQKMIKGVSDTYNYICVDKNKEYFEHLTCRSQPHVNSQAGYCLSSFESSAKRITKKSDVCGLVDTYQECVYRIIKQYCGEAAAEWQKGLEDQLLEPITSLVSCGPNITAIIVGVCVGVGALIIIVAICVIVARKSANKNRPHATV